MDTKLTSAAFVAAIFASSVTWAQQSTSDSTVCKEQQPSASKPSKTTMTKHKETSETSSSKAKTTEKEKDKSADLGTELGEQQKKNEAEAEKMRPKESTAAEKAKTKQEAKQTGEAVGKTTTTAAEVVGGVTRDVTRAVDQPGKYNPVAIEYNPLSLFIGRVSFNVEWAPATHHVFVASPHFAATGATIDVAPNATVDQHITGGGGEIGYRYYTGHRGMNGIFVGPSIIGGAYSADLPSGNKAFTNIGVAVDAGVQAVFFNHLVLGAGVGVEYLKVSHDFNDLPTGPASLAQSGIKPRALASGGYAF